MHLIVQNNFFPKKNTSMIYCKFLIHLVMQYL